MLYVVSEYKVIPESLSLPCGYVEIQGVNDLYGIFSTLGAAERCKDSHDNATIYLYSLENDEYKEVSA